MVLVYDECAIVVEAKTGSQEHKAPSDQYQTIAYPNAVRRRLGLPPSFPAHVVFLTVDGRPAKNSEAFNTTFGAFCLAMLSALDAFDPYRLSAELRAAYSALFTHLLCEAVPLNLDIRTAVAAFTEWDDRLADDAFLVREIDDISAFTAGLARLSNEVA